MFNILLYNSKQSNFTIKYYIIKYQVNLIRKALIINSNRNLNISIQKENFKLRLNLKAANIFINLIGPASTRYNKSSLDKIFIKNNRNLII